jgi:uncharacterized membrane protein SirB2
MTGFQTLFRKELLRFWKVATQTLTAPIVTAMLYLLIFGHVLEEHVQVFPGVSYTAFLVPGLVMMSVLQNAFANSSSSLIQSKITGNLVFVLLAPLSHWEMFGAYVLAAMVRGLAVGTGVFFITVWFAKLSLSFCFKHQAKQIDKQTSSKNRAKPKLRIFHPPGVNGDAWILRPAIADERFHLMLGRHPVQDASLDDLFR